MTKTWIVRVLQEVELEISVKTDDDETPTEEDVYDAMCWADNLRDSYVISQKIVDAESYDYETIDGEPEVFTFDDEVTEDE